MKKSPFELIKERKSHRTYTLKDVPSGTLHEFKSRLESMPQAPFGNSLRFELFEKKGMEAGKSYKLGTYGVITGAKWFLAGFIRPASHAMEDFGYLFEYAVLEAADLGLGTCWLGGSLTRSEFLKAADASHEEIVPCASPLGFSKEKRSLIDRLLVFAAKSAKRKSFEELFFVPSTIGEYKKVLELVRLAPSASNRQPWRLFYLEDKREFHFYMKRTLFYDKVTPVDLQRIDMGIAMCHFELGAKALGLKGHWETTEASEKDQLEYVVSWRCY